jgi:hypothetical protein
VSAGTAVRTASTRVARTDAAVEQAEERVEQVAAQPAAPRSKGTAPAAAAAPTSPPASPLSGGTADAVQERASQAVSYVEDVVPTRSTGLLVALVGGIVALLVLIAREWIR